MKTHALFVLGLLFASTLSAQTVPPALLVKQDDTSVPLGLSKLQTEVQIYGNVAETTTTMTFANKTSNDLEGDLYFPLPEGATISGYALDIQGKMIDGVAVEKHEARTVYEDIVRRGVDPGLAEWTKGNNFHTRVYPIPANGSRTVRVQYVSELIGGKDAPAYHLPLKFKEKVPEFSLRVEVIKPGAAPEVTKGKLANFTFKKWQESYVAQTEKKNWTAVENLVIALPKTDGPQVLVEKADDGQVYFAIQDYPTATTAVDAAKPRPTPKCVAILWDASGSRTGKHQREIDLLRAYLKKWLDAPGQERPSEIDLVLFRDKPSTVKPFDFNKKGIHSLIAELKKIDYDGGTQLGLIDQNVSADDLLSTRNLYLLFTDGISNFGKEDPGKFDGTLHVFSASPTANHPMLRRLAATNGGRYFNLVNWTDADVLAQINRPTWSFLSASIEGGELEDLYPQSPQPVAGRFTLVGRLDDPTATVTINYGYGIPGESPDKQTFTVSSDDAVEGSLLRRLWSQKKLDELMIDQKKNEKQIAALGKQFGLVTPYTSLLVLDSIDQYVEFEIPPPKSLADMHKEYLQRIDSLKQQKEKQKTDKMAEVLRMWNDRVKWWKTKFKYPKNFKAPDQKAQEGQGRGAGMGGGMMGGGRMVGGSGLPAESAASPSAMPSRAAGDENRFLDNMTLVTKMEEQNNRAPGIAITPWNPKTPYLKKLRAAKNERALWTIYMKSRAKYGKSPAFFLDCADFFRESGHPDLALQVLSNIAELELDDPALLRILGHRLAQIGQLDLAVQTFETVLELRPEEPQSYRDLALVLARRAEQATQKDDRPLDAIRKDYARAMDLLVQIILRPWDGRFPQIEVIAIEELNHMIPLAKAAGVTDIPLDPRLIKLLDVDLRIVMTWHADATDIDLWVTEPSGEKAYYNNNRTTIGGLVSSDFTGGYGPEEYMVRKALNGTYKIETNYFGSQAAKLLGPVTVQVDVFTNYGRKNEQRKSLTLRLKETKETIPIGQIDF